MRSQQILNGPEWANVRALYKAAGFMEGELKKPLIGIVNAFNEICPGHTIQIAGKAKIDPKGCIRCFCCHEMCPT